MYAYPDQKKEDKKDKEILIERIKMLTKQQKKTYRNLRQCQTEKKNKEEAKK